MHIEFLVEEPSAEAALRNLVPRIVGPSVSFDVHTYQGKSDLLAKLPHRLKGYRPWLPADWRIVVLVDEDRHDCRDIKSQMEDAARIAGFRTRSSSQARSAYEVVTRLAIEELEAWFFGDVEALTRSFPRVPRTVGQKAKYRNVDQIRGGTWEQLQLVLQRAGYFPGGMSKIDTAREISRHMNPCKNTSPSFRLFRDTLQELTS